MNCEIIGRLGGHELPRTGSNWVRDVGDPFSVPSVAGNTGSELPVIIQ